MPAYARAHVMRDSKVTIGATEYNNQVTTVLLTPETPIQQMATLSPSGTITDVGTPLWSLQLVGIQDNGSGSLGAALRAAAGTLLTLTFQPRTGTGQDSATCSFVAMQIPFGGAQGEFRTFDMTFPISGEPTFTQST